MMTLENFKRQAQIVLDWSVDFYQRLRSLPVKAKTHYGELRVELPLNAPKEGEEFAAIWKDFCEKVVPRVNHWQHPKFFGYFPMNSSYPSVLADMAISTLNTQAMSWELSPAATELEEVVLSWIQQEMRLPVEMRGVIQDTASTSTLCALMAARDRATKGMTLSKGLSAFGSSLILYCSQEAHSSVEKAHNMLGLGRDNVREIPVDEYHAIKIDELQSQIEQDLKAGHTPYALVGCYGTTSTAAVDPIARLSEVAKQYHLWFHVDAAYAGPTLMLPEFQETFQVRNWQFDSLVFNPHKWMLTGFDCSILYVKDYLHYQESFQIQRAYLQTSGEDLEDPSERPTEYRHWTPALGRRFRSLKLWFVMRTYGMEGLRKYWRDQLQMAKRVAEQLEQLPEVKVIHPIHFGLVCFSYQSPSLTVQQLSEFNDAWLKTINENGPYLSGTKVAGMGSVLRMAIGSTFCTHQDVEETVVVIKKSLMKLVSHYHAPIQN